MDVFLDSYGIHLSRHNESFRIKAEDGNYRDLSVNKVKRFFITSGISLTSDALLLAVTNDIEVIFNDRSGFPMGSLWNNRFGSIATIRKNQIKFAESSQSVTWITQLIGEKLDNQMALLSALVSVENFIYKEISEVIMKLQELQLSLQKYQKNAMKVAAPSLRGLEGTASRLYFNSLSKIVPEQYAFKGRSQHPALDMFNCLLNYGYGILYSRIEAGLKKAGLDPSVGIFHRDEYNQPVLVFDIIEKYRVWVDYVVMDLCLQQVIFKEFFDWEEQKCWLNQEGKRILISSVNDYLSEVVIINKRSRSRGEHINDYCRDLASRIKHFKN